MVKHKVPNLINSALHPLHQVKVMGRFVRRAMKKPGAPPGTLVHNVELRPRKGGQMGRAAGAEIRLVSKESGVALLRLPSGEIRRVDTNCMATIGRVGNVDHGNVSLGKAGRKRWLGRRPHTRTLWQAPSMTSESAALRMSLSVFVSSRTGSPPAPGGWDACAPPPARGGWGATRSRALMICPVVFA